MKLYRISAVICNSNFTKGFIDKEYSVKSIVIYPPVNTKEIRPKRKEDVILAVGRFSQLEQAKKQDMLIGIFKKMVDEGFKNWELKLAGGSEVGASKFLKKITKMAKGYPIEIIESPAFEDLLKLYGRAKIFWSGSGFGAVETEEPKKVEHFGISVVESMSAGAVPLVYNAGGHKEIIKNNVNGFLWRKKSKLARLTLELIDDTKLWRKLSKAAKKDSHKFDYEVFREKVEKLL